MQDGIKLERKTKEELKQIALGLGIPKISALKKDELIAAIREFRENVRKEEEAKEQARRKAAEAPVKNVRQRPADALEVCGVLDVMSDGFGFLRFENYQPSEQDVYVSPTQIRRFNLKTGDEILGDCRKTQEEDKYSPLLFVKKINGDPLEVALKRRPFERLTPIYPKQKLSLDTGDASKNAARLIDLVAPIGKGQRGIIVAPPKAGKTTILKQIAQSITHNYPDVKLIVLLIDERPEEVTDIRRSVDGEVIYSTFDQTPENHCKVAEMVLERASRLVEQKKDVVVLMDSITRLARAYNLTVTPTGRTLSGGLDPDALLKPKKFFGAARNIEEGGSFTILATALVETGSRMDDVIFEEFKGTGNMELRLDRTLQERRIFPAIDILKSGTRREEDLMSPKEREAVWTIRREMQKNSGTETVAMLLRYLKSTKTNEDFVDLILNNYGKR
jgi:transcription termination factor Rho